MQPAPMPTAQEQSATAMRARILNVLPAASYQMDRFLGLVDVVLSERSETACVETGPQPRIHVNPHFANRYCRRDEHLLMLILHELYHIILGHTRLFERITLADNIAFDAVINAMLCRQFPDPAYTSFFQRLNPWKRFPGRLLRPPPGWPKPARARSVPNAKREQEVIHRLYGKGLPTATYRDVLDLLQEDETCPRPDNFTLLGDHGGNRPPDDRKSTGAARKPQPAAETVGDGDEAAMNDDLFREILQRVVPDWPDQAKPMLGRGLGDRIGQYLLPRPKSPRAEFLKALDRLLTRAGVRRAGYRTPYHWRQEMRPRETVGALPDWRDRMAYARAVVGVPTLFYRTEMAARVYRWGPREVAHVYLDISGSMFAHLPWLVAALDPLHRRGLIRLYAFSTVVADIGRGGFNQDKIPNTGGTDINCVYRHVLGGPKRNTPNRVVVLTDGRTGQPAADLVQGWAARKIRLYAGITQLGLDAHLAPHASGLMVLPAME